MQRHNLPVRSLSSGEAASVWGNPVRYTVAARALVALTGRCGRPGRLCVRLRFRRRGDGSATNSASVSAPAPGPAAAGTTKLVIGKGRVVPAPTPATSTGWRRRARSSPACRSACTRLPPRRARCRSGSPPSDRSGPWHRVPAKWPVAVCRPDQDQQRRPILGEPRQRRSQPQRCQGPARSRDQRSARDAFRRGSPSRSFGDGDLCVHRRVQRPDRDPRLRRICRGCARRRLRRRCVVSDDLDAQPSRHPLRRPLRHRLRHRLRHPLSQSLRPSVTPHISQGTLMRIAIPRRTVAAVAATLMASAGAVALTPATAASAAAPTGPGPIAQHTANQVTAGTRCRPSRSTTVSSGRSKVVNGIAYAGGEFSNVRPAGAAQGTNLTPRGNLVAINLSTGALVTSFAPSLNAQVKAVAVSPDGSRIYVGGSFTTANGADPQPHRGVQHRDRPADHHVRREDERRRQRHHRDQHHRLRRRHVQPSRGQTRTRLAAFNAVERCPARLGTDRRQRRRTRCQLTPDGSRVIVGGAFANVNGAQARGSAALDATTGASLPWAINHTVYSYNTATWVAHPEPVHRRHGHLRHRMELRRPEQLRGHVLRRPGHRQRQLARGLSRRHLRHLRHERRGLRRQPRALLQQRRRLPRHQPARVAPHDRVHRPTPPAR